MTDDVVAKVTCRCQRAAQHVPDPGLTSVVNAWPELPEVIRAGMVAMVQAAAKG